MYVRFCRSLFLFIIQLIILTIAKLYYFFMKSVAYQRCIFHISEILIFSQILVYELVLLLLFLAPNVEYLKNRNLHTFLYFLMRVYTSAIKISSYSFLRSTSSTIGRPLIVFYGLTVSNQKRHLQSISIVFLAPYLTSLL